MSGKLRLLLCAIGLASLATASGALAQGRGGPPPPANAHVAAPVDLTGQWVSVITEDWRWRMLTPPKGDFSSIPMNPAGRAATVAWDLAADNAAGPAAQCRAWGAGGIMRMPERIRISWADDNNTLKLETDSGQQTRLFKFVTPVVGGIVPALTAASAPGTPRTLQGDARAQWFRQPQSRGLGFGAIASTGGGALRVVVQNTTGGYLRKNGVPYSEGAVITEQFNRHDEPNGDVWLTVTTIVEDARYLQMPFIVSSEFKKEADPSKWSPAPCQTPAPLEAPVTAKAPRGGGAAPGAPGYVAPKAGPAPKAKDK